MTNICAACFHAMPNPQKCPHCGWAREPNPAGTLPLGSMLADRYQIGGVIRQQKDRVVYRAWDSHEKKTIELTEFQPPGQVRTNRDFVPSQETARQKRLWNSYGAFEQHHTVYAIDPPQTNKRRYPVVAVVLILLLGIGLWSALALQTHHPPSLWLPSSAPKEVVALLEQHYHVTVIEAGDYTARILEGANKGTLPDVFYREGFTGNLEKVASQIDPSRLDLGDCMLEYNLAYPSRRELPTAWYATVAYTHTNKTTISPEQLFSGKESVGVADDNWDDLCMVWTGSITQTKAPLENIIKKYNSQKSNQDPVPLFSAGKLDWLIDDTLVRFTVNGSLVPLVGQGGMAGCYTLHWCLGNQRQSSYDVLSFLLGKDAQKTLLDTKYLPLSEEVFKTLVKNEPALAPLAEQKDSFVLFGENRGQAYEISKQIEQQVKEKTGH